MKYDLKRLHAEEERVRVATGAGSAPRDPLRPLRSAVVARQPASAHRSAPTCCGGSSLISNQFRQSVTCLRCVHCALLLRCIDLHPELSPAHWPVTRRLYHCTENRCQNLTLEARFRGLGKRNASQIPMTAIRQRVPFRFSEDETQDDYILDEQGQPYILLRTNFR